MDKNEELKQQVLNEENKKDDGLNDKQREAVYIRGANTLVSAGAGSGKTYVLTKRVISLLTDEKNPVDIDRLFVATFTVSATGEMTERIRKAINDEIKRIRKEKNKKENLNKINELEKHENHLRKQISLLNRASITTIDSYCSTVVKQNFQKLIFETDEETLSLDPNFKICDSWENDQMQSEAMDEFMELKYQEKNPNFMALCDNLCQNYTDRNLKTVILSVLNKIENFSNREKWFEQIMEMYRQIENISNEDDYYTSDFAKAYKELFAENVDDINDAKREFDINIGDLKERLAYLDSQTKLTDTIRNGIYVADNINDFVTKLNESYISESAKEFSNLDVSGVFGGRLLTPAKKGDKEKNNLKIEAIEIANEIKTNAKIFKENVFDIFASKYESISYDDFEILKKQAPLIETLIDCVRDYSKILMRKKFEQQKYTFNDIARFCHDILVDENGNKTAVAERYSEEFAEIIVDEYQDISFLQDDILRAISNGHNLFMVGDIKQAIYRFREANPEVFNEKYKKYEVYKGKIESDKEGYKIMLSENYRSRKQILEASNYIFNGLMSETLGEVEYGEDTKLITGSKFHNADDKIYNTEIVSIYKPSKNTKKVRYDSEIGTMECTCGEYYDGVPEDADIVYYEASEIAHRIKELVGTMDISIKNEPNKTRKLEYGDICILMKTLKLSDVTGTGNTMKEYLMKAGIPVSLKLENALVDTFEVKLLLNFLRVLDNPMQDIPLVSLLYSTVYNFSADELVEIKKAEFNSNIYIALLKYCENDNENAELKQKAQQVIDDINKFRNMALETSMYDLISEIYLETNLYNYVSFLPDGKNRKVNLILFKELALEYDAKNCFGINGFLDFAENTALNAQDLGSASDSNSVKISTIHKSKGLEYPVVFVANLGRASLNENHRDTTERAFIDKNLLAVNYRDSFEMQSYGTIPNYIGKLRKKHLELSEVMRLFYVACTRAREKLILIGCNDSVLDVTENKDIYQNKNGKFIPTLMQKQNNIMKWLSYTVKGCKEDYIDVENIYVPNMQDYLIKNEEVTQLQEDSLSNIVPPQDIKESDEYINIAKKLDWVYPNEFASQIPTNMSITEIKRRHTAEIVENGDTEKIASSFREQNAVYPMPKFMKENADKISPAQLGSVYHAILEKLDFLTVSTEDEVQNAVDTFVKKGFLSVNEAEAVDLKKIVAFLNSPLGQRIKKIPVEDIHKESTFIMYMTPDEVAKLNGTLPEEFWGSNYKKVEDRILINGIIDLYFKDGDNYVLVDYKTDNVKSMEELVERYEVQLKFYKKALEMNYNIEISELVIYSLKLNSQIIL